MKKIFPTFRASLLLVALSATIAPLRADISPAQIPQKLRAPALACDDTSVVLVWEKPADYADVTDYNVYLDGRKLGGAIENADAHSPAKKYFDAFYAADPQNFHVRISIHCFTATGLKPGTEYTFTVRSVLKDGRESADSAKFVARTAATPRVFNVADFGAKGDGATTNTKQIQAAIDACTPGGKVLVPSGVFKSGALFLKSEMTLEIAEGGTLLGSENPDEYPMARGYRLYPYSTNERPPSLLNALPAAEAHDGTPAFTNIRIVGRGTIDGNGWKRAAKSVITDEAGRELPQYVKSNNTKVGSDGILAKAQTERGVTDGLDVKTSYGQRRSSLVTLRGVRGVYYAGLTILNPANHALMNLECVDVVLTGLSVQTFDANNADGVELGNCTGAMVFNNLFDTGDDSINFAAGTGREACKQPPQSGAWIFNNYCRKGHGAVVVGSHTGAWIEKILAEDNVVNGSDAGLRCKSSPINGGGGREIIFRDTAVRDILRQPFVFTLEYNDNNAAYDYEPAEQSAVFRDISVSNVTVERTVGKDASILVKAAPEKGVFHERIIFENVTMLGVNPATIDGLKSGIFKNVVFTSAKPEEKLWNITNSESLVFAGTTTNQPPRPAD